MPAAGKCAPKSKRLTEKWGDRKMNDPKKLIRVPFHIFLSLHLSVS